MDTSLAEFWDEYWTKKLQDEFWLHMSQVSFIGKTFTEYMEALHKRDAHCVLFPGNGCSLLPQAFVHCGFRVIVVDISAVANESVAAVQPTPKLLTTFLPVFREVREDKSNVFRMDREASLQRVHDEALEGGSLTIITADILEWEAPEPVDAIFDDRLAMLLTDDACPILAQKYYHWLSEQGICFLHTINLGGTIGQDVSDRRTPFENAFTTAGFQSFEPHYLRGKSKDIPLLPATPNWLQRFLQRFEYKPEETVVKPAPDGKLVCFLHGSG